MKCLFPNFKGKFFETRNTIEIGIFVALKWAENSGCHGPDPRVPLTIFKKKKIAKQSESKCDKFPPFSLFSYQRKAMRVRAGTMSTHSFSYQRKAMRVWEATIFEQPRWQQLSATKEVFHIQVVNFITFLCYCFFQRKLSGKSKVCSLTLMHSIHSKPIDID